MWYFFTFGGLQMHLMMLTSAGVGTCTLQKFTLVVHEYYLRISPTVAEIRKATETLLPWQSKVYQGPSRYFSTHRVVRLSKAGHRTPKYNLESRLDSHTFKQFMIRLDLACLSWIACPPGPTLVQLKLGYFRVRCHRLWYAGARLLHNRKTLKGFLWTVFCFVQSFTQASVSKITIVAWVFSVTRR